MLNPERVFVTGMFIVKNLDHVQEHDFLSCVLGRVFGVVMGVPVPSSTECSGAFAGRAKSHSRSSRIIPFNKERQKQPIGSSVLKPYRS